MKQTTTTTRMNRLGFYVGRLRKERVTKVLAVSMAVMALMLQLVSGVLPMTSDDAYATRGSADNIVSQGINNTSDMLNVYDRNVDAAGHKDIKQIYTQFGVSRQDIANAKLGSYKTNDFGGKLNTLSRINWKNSGRSAVNITGGTTIYTGPFLDGANQKAFIMPALIGKRAVDGQWFAITLDCGNLVYITPPTPPKPQPTPAAACVSLKVEKISRTGLNLIAKASTANGATVKAFHYVVAKDGKTVTDRVIPTTGLGSQINQGYETGTYTAKVTVQTSLGDKTSAACATTFTIAPPPVVVKDIKVCDLKTKMIITISEKDFDSSKHSKNLEDCKPVKPAPIDVCDLATKTIIKIEADQFDSAKHSKNFDDCKPAPIEVCDLDSKTIITIEADQFDSSKHSKDTADCATVPPVTPPVTPPELPRTGATQALSGVFGAGSIIASIGYFVASRRSLLSALSSR